MNDTVENGRAVGLLEACGGDAAALATVLRGMIVRTYVVDKNFHISRADGPLSVLFGDTLTKEVAVPGGNLLDALDGKERDQWSQYLREILANPECPHCHSYARRNNAPQDGETSFVCVAARIVRHGQKPAGIRFVTLEISERELAAAFGDDHRDARPSVEEGLAVAKQLATTLNHEINNPLFVVSATLEDVLSEALEPEMRARLQTALDKTWQAVDAVKQLQDVQRIVSTSYIPGFTMIDLEASSQRQKKPAKQSSKS